MRFLDLTIADDIPDSRTVWNFREQITDLGLVEELFSLFIKELDTLGLIVNAGKIVDASFIEVPRQRNKVTENEQIKDGRGSKLLNDKPNKKRQKDIDARRTKKNKHTFLGYKTMLNRTEKAS